MGGTYFDSLENSSVTFSISRGLTDVRGWSVSLETPDVDIYMGGNDYVMDMMSYLELPREFPAAKPHFVVAPSQRAMERVATKHIR